MELPAIDSLDDLVAAIDAVERAQAQIAVAAAGFADAGVWAGDGSLSMAAWLVRNARVSHADARRLLKCGRFLRDFDHVRAAALDRRLPASHVTAVVAVVAPALREVFAETQEGTVEALVPLDACDAERACAAWKQRAEALAATTAPKLAERELRMSTVADGTMVAHLVLDPDAAVQLQQAIGTASRFDGTDDQRTPARRRADALVDVLAFFNANHTHAGTPRHRSHVELHVQEHDLRSIDRACAVTSDGRSLATWATDAFLCDCVVHRVLRAGAAVLDYGREVRTVPAPLARAIHARDCRCRFPGCDRPGAWCDVHHIHEWVRGGRTEASNLLLLCNRHHHLVHRDRWTIQLDADASVTFTSADGATWTEAAPDRFHTGPPGHAPPGRTPVAA